MSQIPANYCADNVLAPLFPEHMGIGMNIRRARKHAGLTQEQLADRAAVQQSDVSKWETDTALPELLSLVKVATVHPGSTFNEIASALLKARESEKAPLKAGESEKAPRELARLAKQVSRLLK